MNIKKEVVRYAISYMENGTKAALHRFSNLYSRYKYKGNCNKHCWYADRVSHQFSRDIAAANVNLSLKLSVLKPLHANLIVELYDHLKKQNEAIIKGFDKAGITDDIRSANDIYQRCENPFQERKFNGHGSS